MSLLVLFSLLTGVALAQTLHVDAGSDSADQYCKGGLKRTIDNLPTDKTVLYDWVINAAGQRAGMTCSIPAEDGKPYIVTLHFTEPAARAKGLRLFAVKVNDAPSLDRFDIFASCGYLTDCDRSTLAIAAGGKVKIDFVSQAGYAAVVTSFDVTPFVWTTIRHATGVLLSRTPGAGFLVIPQDQSSPVLRLVVYRNNTLQTLGVDYQVGQALVTPFPVYVVIAPLSSWPDTDVITCDFDQVIGAMRNGEGVLVPRARSDVLVIVNDATPEQAV